MAKDINRRQGYWLCLIRRGYCRQYWPWHIWHGRRTRWREYMYIVGGPGLNPQRVQQRVQKRVQQRVQQREYIPQQGVYTTADPTGTTGE